MKRVFGRSWARDRFTGNSSREHVTSQFGRRVVTFPFVLIAITLVATAAVGSEAGSPKALPDAPSTVLVPRSQGFAEDTSQSQPLSSGRACSEESTSQQNTRPSLLRRAVLDQKAIYTAPFRRRNLQWSLLFLVATGGLIAGDKHISGAVSSAHASISQHISDIGMYSMTASVAGLWLSSLKTQDDHARETGILAAEAFANTAAIVGVAQLIAGRERPTEGNGSGRFWQNNALSSSFPSAHSSFTWTMASVLAHEYPRPWVRWLVYGAATTVSVTRVTGLKHFPADVEVGGVLGYLVGQQIFNAHCVRGLSAHCHSSGKRIKDKATSLRPISPDKGSPRTVWLSRLD